MTAATRASSARRPPSRIGSVTFCRTVRAGSRLKPWKTKPTRSRRSRVSAFSRIPVISRPSSMTDPEVGRSSPAAQWRNVVFPDPDGPMTAVIVPFGKPIVTPASASTDPPPLP
jgi:hypothetical protein